MEYSSNDVKQLFRSVYTLVKGQDELKAGLTASETLAPKFLLSHRLLVSQCIQLMFEDFESVGRKSREILWRKGYYDVISALKRQKGRTDGRVLLEAADQLIREGINYFKAVVLRFGDLFHLETLKHLVDYALLEDYDDEALRQESTCYSLLQLRPASQGSNPKELYTKQEVSYALETIHTLLIALGDLHRYRMEFGIGNRIEIRDRTRSYYMEAFKLNPKIGMAQNQLGMLVAGQNHNLDAVYHYLYSLCCANPFECSETNVSNIFQKNILLLENGGLESSDFADEDDHAVKQFISAFLLVVDVFFYNKDVTDFMSLCHSVLIDFKKVLGIRQLLEEYVMTEDMIFKVVSILFFCMYRIKLTNSDKIHSLNAFLVALCSELLEYCTMGVEKCIVENVRDDNRFREMYLERYRLYDEQVHRARTMAKHGVYSKDQKSSSGVEEGTGSQDSRGTSNADNPNCKDKPKDKTAKKTAGGQRKQSRRRRRAYSNGSDSDGNGDEEDMDEYSNGNYDSDFDFSESDSSVDGGEEEEEEEEDDMISLSSFGSYDDYTGGEEDEREDGTGRTAKKKHSNLAREVAQQPRGPAADEEFKYKKRYNKTNPNIVLEFAQSDRTIRSLKMLFDWLLCNMDVLHNCYQSNPEFVHNIMKLLNHFNIDIFTNRFFFCREFITMDGLREDLHSIFLARRTIPLREDVAMKRFPLFEPTQDGLQWELPYKLGISAEDECLLRMMKLVDFGFTVCKSKKFDYCFVPKTREFSLRAFRSQSAGAISKSQQRRRKKKLLAGGNKSEWNGGGKQQQQQGGKQRAAQHQRQMGEKRRDRDGGGDRQPRLVHDDDDPGDIFHFPQEYKRNRHRKQEQHDDPSSLPEGNGEQLSLFTKKGYLRNRENGILRRGAAGGRVGELGGGSDCAPIGKEKRPTPVLQPKPVEKKKDLRYKMGRLYLRHCVGTRESELQVNKRTVRFSPYLVLDAKCLSEYTSIVKNLVKTGTFIVLIPSIVLSELDETKKDNDGARNAIKWLETEFGAGNRFLRTQTANESQPMPLVKIPKKLDREGVIFQHIVQFCNHFVSNHPDKDKNSSIITYLSGDNLSNKKFGNGSSYVGILEAIPVKFEQIVTFYSSYKRK